VVLAEAGLALQVEKLGVSRQKLKYGRKTIPHIQGDDNKNGCLKQLGRVISLLMIILSAIFHILYMKAVVT